ncbi:response regulator [Nodosilinea sp. FACHB-141]|uniref:Response regulator n=1 Tax=Leptolyngbya subtilissima DQ-A4 TaxID=2933933 RepID=A0ABV0K1Q7_9CYAN|nr:response regulator [Nodosilinea sp. FACHB-141]MBD2107337.1 response regulator [Nodosilinea sp. FACHB-13]MBD2111474.1 response regulator [Nodosilinea sp. FACHB-141]
MCTPSDFRILVVDDIEDNLFLLRTVLETEGYEVETAGNGGSALAKVENAPPDLILMDVMMPDMNGYEVTKKIRQNPALPQMPILIVTAYDTLQTSQGLALEPNNFIRKPIEFDQLLTKVAALLEANHHH